MANIIQINLVIITIIVIIAIIATAVIVVVVVTDVKILISQIVFFILVAKYLQMLHCYFDKSKDHFTY